MPLLELLSEESAWKRYYHYKTSLVCRSPFEKELSQFIRERSYLDVCENIRRHFTFPLPSKAVINKSNSEKKRVVYLYPRKETIVLKLLTFLLIRRYDDVFSDNLYSFRPDHSAKNAVSRLVSMNRVSRMYFYKADISNYFNSVPIPQFLPILEDTLQDDPMLFTFLRSLLTEPNVLDKGKVIQEQKGIMAGVPLSSLYANLYLKDMDQWFLSRRIPYARYSDDIILFAETEEETRRYAETVRSFLAQKGLSLNPQKELLGTPDTPRIFLGFSFTQDKTDIAPQTIKKQKAKMRRKTKALRRWQQRNDLERKKAAAAFIRIFNRKLLESPQDHELTWSYWFFSAINTTESLQQLDHYAQECIRYLISSRRTKSRFRVRYQDIKKLGYKSLVHEYWNYQPK